MTRDSNPVSLDPPAKGFVGWFSESRLIPIVVASALFMDLMDSAALAMALPKVARHFGVPVVELRLAFTVYVVTVAVLVPTSGWMASRFGARRVFLAAMTLFMLGSICCGMAQNVTQLVLARVLQGIGGSMMTPVGRMILVASIARTDLVRGMAWYTLPAILAPVVGPPVAGLLIQFADWRWIFFINVPVGLLGIFAVLRFVPALRPTRRRRFDLPGFLLAGASILGIMAMVETGALAGQPLGLRLAGVASSLLLACLYVRQALGAEEPIADLRVLRHPTFRWSLIATWLHRVALGGFMLLLPLQLQIGFNYSPLVSSQVMIASALGSVLSRFISPVSIRLFGFRLAMLYFGTITVILTIIPATFVATTPIFFMAAVMLIYSAIRASFFMAGNTLSYCDVHGAEIGHASVLFAISQQLSLGLGFNIATGVLARAGGAHDVSAFAWAYGVIALLPLIGTLAVRPLRADVGEDMRQRAST